MHRRFLAFFGLSDDSGLNTAPARAVIPMIPAIWVRIGVRRSALPNAEN